MHADIRPARASDLDALGAIESAVFDTDRISRRSFRRLMDSPTADILVAESSGAVAGYCVVLFRAGSASARLYSIAVTERGKGIGSRLLAAAEQAAVGRGGAGLSLEVRHDNDTARALYERHGFGIVDRMPNYYEDGAPALRYAKRLGADEARAA